MFLEEIRFHGRAGQGVVTAAKALAVAASIEGKHAMAFPLFGSEKRGPPVMSFCRISDEKIDFIEQIKKPTIIVVTDPSVIDEIDVTKGLVKGGLIIINSKHGPGYFKFDSKNVFTVDGTALAYKYLGKPITNTVMLGALVKLTGLVSIDSIKEGVKFRLRKLPEEMLKLNLDLIEECYNKTEARK